MHPSRVGEPEDDLPFADGLAFLDDHFRTAAPVRDVGIDDLAIVRRDNRAFLDLGFNVGQLFQVELVAVFLGFELGLRGLDVGLELLDLLLSRVLLQHGKLGLRLFEFLL